MILLLRPTKINVIRIEIIRSLRICKLFSKLHSDTRYDEIQDDFSLPNHSDTRYDEIQDDFSLPNRLQMSNMLIKLIPSLSSRFAYTSFPLI